MSDRRAFRWASTSARVLAGALVAAGTVVAVVAAIAVPWPTVTRAPVSIVAKPAPASTVLSCDGGLLVLGRDLADAGSLAVAAPQSVVSGAAPGTPEPVGHTLSAIDIPNGEGPRSYTAPPLNGAHTDVAAAGAATASAPDLIGFAASACRPPLMESWLVAGSGATGSADFVVLSNPGSVAATVQLTVFGATGAAIPPGGADLVVPAQAQRVVPIAGLARGETSPLIRVNAVGAPVQASVQSSIMRVLEPGGVEQTGAVPATGDVQRIVGVAVTGEPDGSGVSTVLRVLSPGVAAEATVTIRGVGDGRTALAPFVVPLAPGVPTEVELGDLAIGEYVVDVTATAPVVSGVWQATGLGAGSDFAWYAPSPEITVPTLFAVPPGPPATLTLVNPGDQSITVAVARADGGDPVDITLEGGASATAPLSRGGVYALDSRGAAVLAGVTMSGPGALSAFPVWPADAAAPAITVYP